MILSHQLSGKWQRDLGKRGQSPDLQQRRYQHQRLHWLAWRQGLGDKRWQYSLALSSKLVVAGCNVQVTLHSTTPGRANGYAAGCSSLCNDTAIDHVLSAGDIRNYNSGQGLACISKPINSVRSGFGSY
jgi:hypothetical protein